MSTDSGVTLIRRAPDQEGDFMCGCHYWDSDYMAVFSCNDQATMSDMEVMSALWDLHMRKWVKSPDSVKTKHAAQQEGLRWILEHCSELTRRVINICNEGREEDLVGQDPNSIRDWFCWLYRHFKYIIEERKIWEENKK